MTSRRALYETIKIEKKSDSIGGKGKRRQREGRHFNNGAFWGDEAANIISSIVMELMKIGIDVPFSIRESCGLHSQI